MGTMGSRRKKKVAATETPRESDRRTGRPPKSKVVWWVVGGLLVAAIALQQGFTASWLAEAETALACRQLDQADRLFERASQWRLRKGDLALRRARIARYRDDEGAFSGAIDAASALGASPTEVRQEELLMSIQSGRAIELADNLDTLLASSDDRSAIFEAFTEGFLSVGDYRSAEAILQQWLRFDPLSPIANAKLGGIRFDFERNKEAKELFSRSLSQCPHLIEARLGMARVCYSLDQTKAALTHFTLVSEAQPQHLEARLSRASLLKAVGRPEEAAEEFQAVLDRYPESFAARFELASYWASQGQGQRVIDLLSPIEKRFSDEVSINYLMGNAYAQLGDVERSDAYLKKYFTGRKRIDSLAEVRATAESDPQDFASRKRLALQYLKYQWDEAGYWIGEAMALQSSDQELRQALAELVSKNGGSAAGEP